MAYKKSIFKDKTVIALSAISIVAAAALIGGIALDKEDTSNIDKNNKIVDLNESDTTLNMVKSTEKTEAPTTTEKETTSIKREETISPEEETTPMDSVANVSVNKLKFTADSILTWPVDGNIIIDYDMDNTVYFPTLNLYKCSDAISIQSDVGTPVYASADCIVNEIGHNEEIGAYVLLDLGNNYVITLGQLKDIVINPNDVIESGDLIGYVSEPTDYYAVEGPNLYVKLTENGNPVNPLDYLNYE